MTPRGLMGAKIWRGVRRNAARRRWVGWPPGTGGQLPYAHTYTCGDATRLCPRRLACLAPPKAESRLLTIMHVTPPRTACARTHAPWLTLIRSSDPHHAIMYLPQGSGLSEGQWVTLGAEEVDDVEAAVEHLRASGRVSTLGLWGRSMGAVTALLYSQRDPSIAGMVSE